MQNNMKICISYLTDTLINKYFIHLAQLQYFCYPILPVKDGRLELLMDASFPISSLIPLKSVFWVSEAEWGSESIN